MAPRSTLVLRSSHGQRRHRSDRAQRDRLSTELTPPELKLTYSALKALLNDFGHDEHDVQLIIRSVLNKLPPPERIESIDLQLPRRRRRL